MNKQNNQNIQGRTDTRTDQQILEKHTGVQEKVRGYMKRGKLRRIIAILSAFVLLFTLNSLKFRADTLQRIAMCGLEEHTHTEACYNEAGELVCGRTEHEHTDACYQQRPVQPEPTVFDEFKDLNSQVVLASPMEEDVSVSSDSVDETVGETTMDLDADSADEGIDAEAVTDEGGLEVEYDLDDLYGEDGDEATIVDDYVENDAADAGNDADQTVAEYSLNGGSVAFLSDVLRATGLEVSGITAVGEIADDAFVDTHIAVEPVEGVDSEYVLKVTESFDRVQLGVATADAIETVWLTDGQAVAAVYDEAQTSDETVVAEEAAEPAEPAEEIVEQTEETFNSNETIETEQKQTEVGEIETEVGMDADVSGDQDASSDEENRVEAEAAPIENDESVTEYAADASDVQGVEDAAGDNAVAENEDAADAAVGEDASSVEDEQAGEDAADATVGEDASSDEDEQAGEDEQAAVVADRKVSLDFTNYIVDDAHTVYLYDAEMRAVLVNTAEIETVDGVVVTAAEEEAANEAADEAAEDESGEESEETGADEGGVLIIEGDGEYALNGTVYVVTGLVLPEAAAEEAQGAEQSGEEIQDAEAPAEEAQADEETAVGDQSADDAQDEAAPAEKTVALDFTDYIATDDHAVFLYDASMVAVLVNEAEIASADGVTVTLPEEAAEETDEALADAEEDAEAPAEEAADDAQAGEGALIITGDGEYALNGTTYVVTGLVLPEKAVGNDNITIATTNDEATLLNVAPVFEETDEDYDDIFSLFTMAKDDPTLLARVMDILGGVAYAEEGEVGRDLNVKVFRICLEDVTTGEAVEPGTELHVETSLDAPVEGEEFQLYHIENGKAELIPDAVVVEDGQAVGLNFNTVSLDKFALVYYTVNVVVEEKNITIDVDFTDVVENGVDFDSQAILTALNDGVAIDVASLLAGETGDSLIVEASATADVDVENLEATAAEGGVTYADGAIKVTGDGAITLTDSVYTIIINVTNYQTLVEKELKADGVTVEVIDGEVPAGSTVTYEALSDAHTEALVEEYIPEAVPASAEAEPAPAEAKAAASGEEEADSASAEETVEEPQEAAEAPSDATDESVEEKSEEKIETATGYTAFDVSIAMPEGDEFTKEGQFAVTVDHAVDAASLVPEGAVIDNITYELFHIHNGEATQIEDVAVADGQVSFTTDGFSEYVIRYTVDFEVEGDQGEITLDFKAFDATTLPGEGEIYYDTEDCCIHVALGLLTGIINSEAEALYDIDVNANLVDHYEFDFDKAEMGKSDSGMRFADGELIIASDGFVELTEGERLLRVRATGLTALKQALLEAENVSIEVVSGNVPLGSEASYTAHTDEETAELVENYINNEENGDSEVAGYSAADLKIIRNDETLPVEGQFKVTVDKASLVPEGMKLDKLYHIHRNENDEAVVEELAFEETEAGLVFELANFSDIVAGYTVDFEYNGYKWSFPGLGSYSIASIMEEIGVEGEITHVSLKLVEGEEVEGALYLEEKEDGWYLTSDVAFDETYELIVVVDGSAYGITVTDAQGTLTTTIKFFAKDAEIIKKDQDPNFPQPHINGLQEAPTNPALQSHYYVLAILKNKNGNELGWAIKDIDTPSSDSTQTYFSEFNAFEGQGEGETAEQYAARRGQSIDSKILYDTESNEITLRLYRADQALSTVNYQELVTKSATNSTYETPEEGYEFGGSFVKDNKTEAEIHLKKANNKKYKVRIYLDENAKDDIAASDNYYLYLKVNHASGDPSHYYVKLDIDADAKKGSYVEFDFPHWMDNNGNVKTATSTNNTFTGNEQGVEVRLLKYDGDFKPNNYTNATVNEEGSAIKAYKVHYNTAEYNSGNYYTEETTDADGKTIVNCIDKVELQTIDAEGKYNYASILGPNLNYGIVADHLYHENHLQTNFAVNHYTGHGHDARPDLSGSSGGQIVIGEYNTIVSDFWTNGPVNGVGEAVTTVDIAGQLKIGNPLTNTLVVYADDNSGAPGALGTDDAKVRGTLDKVVVIQTDGAELSTNIVEPALHYMDRMSAELAAQPATFAPAIPSNGKLTIDTTAFPDDATIFIDADPIKKFIGSAGDLIIEKKPNQTIIFNFKETHTKSEEITLAQFVVKQEGFPAEGYTTHSPVGTGDPQNVYMDAIARHIVWNLYGVEGKAIIDISGGIYLQPNENSVIDVKGTTAGWIVSEGLVSNGSGEWHNVFAEMPDTSSVKLDAYKTVDGKQPRASQKFQFFLDEYHKGASTPWQSVYASDTKIFNSTGSISFPEIKNLTTGWHVYRITENQVKPTDTNGYFIMDGDSYYAVVNVKTTTTQTGQAATIVSTPVYYRNFDPDAFDPSSETLTGFSNTDKVGTVTFDNEEITDGLNILKKVQGTTANDIVFTFKVELWFEDTGSVQPYVQTGDTAETLTMTTATGTAPFVLSAGNNVDNHSVGYVTLKAGELVNIQGIDVNAHYRITETKVNGQDIEDGATYVKGYKRLTAEQTGDMSTGLARAVFENEYKAFGTLDLKAHKTLTDKTGQNKQLAANSFAFRLVGHNAVNPTKWIWNDAEGKVAFPTINYSSADMEDAVPDPSNDNKLTKTLIYTVHENHELGTGANNLAAQNVTYDDDKTVTVTLVDNGDGTITATADVADLTVEFNNTYEYQVPKGFEGTKVLTGREMADQEFWFNAVLTKYSDGTTETTYTNDTEREAVDFVSATKVEGTNRANGNILFPVITFKQAGTYTFTVTEDKTRLPDDVEPTTLGQSYDVTIVVTEGMDSTTKEKILVAGEPTYTNNKTINNTQKKMGFTVTKDWKDMAGANVNNGHSITFAVTKDGEAYSVTSEHIEKVAGTPGSFTVSEGKVTLTADANGWPTVKLKELDYPDTAAGYVVVEDAPTPSDENARVVVKYALNGSADADNCPAIAHNDAALVIKNIEEDNSTRLKVTKHYILPDGSDGNDTASKNPIYFAVKLHHNDNGWTSYYDNGSAINVGSTKGYQITWDSAKNEWTTVEIGEIPETVRVNENDAPVLKYEVVELDSNGQEKTTGDSLLEIKYYVNYGKATQEEVTPITQGQGAAITIENKIPQPRELTVTKAWVDEDGVALTDLTGRDTISFKLVFKNAYNGKYYVVKDANGDISLTDNESNASTFTLHGSIVEGEQVWETVTFKNLPYLSNASDSGSTGGYYVVETVGNGPEVTFVLNNGSTTTNIDESHPYDPHNSGTITIVNKEVDKSIKVKKVWIGPNPPDSIDVVLKYKYVEYPEWGEQTNGITNSRVVLNAANNWSYAWENLPESDINGTYAYFVTEYAHDDNGSATNPVSGYDVEYSSNNGTLKAGDTVTITNTKQTTGIAVKKFWDDELELVKAPVDIALKEADCVPVAGALQVRIYDEGSSETEDTPRQTIYVKSGTDIVIEGGLIQGKSNIYYNPSTVSGTISGQSNEILTISNVTVAFDVHVTNGWGQGQQYNLRYTPDIEIDDNSVVEKDRVTLNDENNWYHEWTSNLNPDKYYFVEEVTPGYDVTYSNNNGIKTGLITATNSKTTPQYGSLKLTKEVKVNGQTPTSAGQYALVDGSYTFTVTGPGSATTVNKAVVITINNGAVASATVDGSPVTLQEGYVVISGLSEGDYTVVEQAVTGMTTTVSGGTSTDPSTRTVTVHVTPGSTISPEATAVFTNNRNKVDLNIVKVDKDDTTKRLTGAKFKVMRRDLDSTADYQVFANNAFETNESGQSTGIVPVDDDGQITLSGLMPGEYQVSEVKAPAGYIILNSEFTFTIQTDGTVVYEGGNNMVTYTSAEHKFEVKNEPGVSLPATGGPGTSMFYVFGSIITLLAAVLLITKRRSGSAE